MMRSPVSGVDRRHVRKRQMFQLLVEDLVVATQLGAAAQARPEPRARCTKTGVDEDDISVVSLPNVNVELVIHQSTLRMKPRTAASVNRRVRPIGRTPRCAKAQRGRTHNS